MLPHLIQGNAIIQRIAFPAKAGIHSAAGAIADEWIQAFAGKAMSGGVTSESFLLRALNQS
jgi:hypothetical protein